MLFRSKSKQAEGDGDNDLVTRVEFEDFAAQVQKKLDAFTRGQEELANVQADTSENLNKVQAATNPKLDRLAEMLSRLIARDSTPPDFRRDAAQDRGSSVQGNFSMGVTSAVVQATIGNGEIAGLSAPAPQYNNVTGFCTPVYRSEERRVGKECLL